MLRLEDKEWALFTGIEQEGPLKGNPTLFVKGDVPLDVIEATLNTDHCDKLCIQSIYFGACFRSEFNPDTVAQVLEKSIELDIENISIESTKINSGWFGYLLNTVNVEDISIYAIVDVVWQGQFCEEGDKLRKELLDLDLEDNVIVKFDLADRTYTVMADDVLTSDYKDYEGDTLVASKDAQ